MPVHPKVFLHSYLPFSRHSQSWMRVLRHDVTLLVHAAAQAQRAADYIQNLCPAPDA